MTTIAGGDHFKAGLASPVCVSGVLLLLSSPVMRGGNRPLALIVLEAISLVVLLLLWAQWARGGSMPLLQAQERWSRHALALLLASPAWLALVYLLPLPQALWALAPGRSAYLQPVADAGATLSGWLPLSLVPQATWVSLLAGLPLLAAFLLGRHCSLRELRLLGSAVLAMGVCQVLLGLLQIAGGRESALFFGATGGRPIGSFANSNHFANYLFMALMLCIWMAVDTLGKTGAHRSWQASAVRSAPRHLLVAWVALATLLLLGVLMSLSRGAALAGLPMAGLALVLVMARVWRGHDGSRRAVVLIAVAASMSVLLLGLDSVLSRFSTSELAGSAGFRGLLAQSTLAGAWSFWPLGAGWGTYGDVYPRFQPAAIPGYAGHAHQDYAQMLFEGGLFALLLAAAFAWLAGQRALLLARALWHQSRLQREVLPVLLCGLGLAGFLLHSLVEFNMHIPANAMLAALLAGVYLRPLPQEAAP